MPRKTTAKKMKMPQKVLNLMNQRRLIGNLVSCYEEARRCMKGELRFEKHRLVKLTETFFTSDYLRTKAEGELLRQDLALLHIITLITEPARATSILRYLIRIDAWLQEQEKALQVSVSSASGSTATVA